MPSLMNCYEITVTSYLGLTSLALICIHQVTQEYLGVVFFVKLFVCDTNHSDTHILFQRSWHIWKFVKMYVDILLVRKLEHIYLFII